MSVVKDINFHNEEGIICELYLEIVHGLLGATSSVLYHTQITKELLSPLQTELLLQIKDVGEKYRNLKSFLDEVNQNAFTANPCGLYLSSFAEHLEECLQPYTNDIISLESEKPCLQNVYSKLYPYDELLTGLVQVVEDLRRYDRNGVIILQVLHSYLQSSVRTVRIALKLITRGVSKVFFKQLQLWLLHGELFDRRHEFFIARKQQFTLEDSSMKLFSIDSTLVPTFIRPSLAEKILNVGKTILLLRSRPNSGSDEVKPAVPLDVDHTGITRPKWDEITQQINEIVNGEIWRQWDLLEPVVNGVASIATAQLHLHAMRDANLMQQLHLTKDLFLMGRGELFHEFVVESDSQSIKDYTLVLKKCARKVLINEELLKPFTLEVAPSDGGPQLNWVYSVPWPLQLLFTEEVIASYNHIFRFLLRLKRIQAKMVAAWLKEKSKRSDKQRGNRRQLQQSLWFLVNNLQYYLQVDVLDSQFLSLETAVKESKDFEEIKLCHSKFLANLTTQSFLDLPQENFPNPVQQRLLIILSMCEEYCCQSDKLIDDESSAEAIDSLANKFDSSFEYLMALLIGLKNKGAHPCSQHLAQFLLRLDFNYFFSNKYAGRGLFAQVM